MPTKVLIVFHSLYTHVYQLAEAVAAGAREVPDTEVVLAQVAETLPHEVLEKMGAVEAKKVVRPRARGRPARPGRRGRRDPRDPHARMGPPPPRCRRSSTRPAASGSRGARRQGRQRLHLHRQPARRPGDDPRPHAHLLLPPGDGGRRRSLHRPGAAQPRRDLGRDALRRLDHRRPEGRALLRRPTSSPSPASRGDTSPGSPPSCVAESKPTDMALRWKSEVSWSRRGQGREDQGRSGSLVR